MFLVEKCFLEPAVLPWNNGRTGGSTIFWRKNGYVRKLQLSGYAFLHNLGFANNFYYLEEPVCTRFKNNLLIAVVIFYTYWQMRI